MSNITGQWVILGYGRSDEDIFVGPGDHDTIYPIVSAWNDIAQSRKDMRVQMYFMKRVSD